MNQQSTLTDLALQFTLLSVMSIGGIIAVVPEMHAAVVDRHGWMTSEVFVTLFALAQAAPGPNVVVVTLIGWHVAGAMGALVATIAVSAPSFALTYAASRMWSRFNGLDWYKLFERGAAPVTIGLVLSSGLLLSKVASDNWGALAVTAATVAVVLRWRKAPHLMLAAGALAGALGLV